MKTKSLLKRKLKDTCRIGKEKPNPNDQKEKLKHSLVNK
jgi:hypothetical protein